MPRSTSCLAVLLVAGCSEYKRPPASPDLIVVFPTGCSSGALDGDQTDVDCGGGNT